MKWRGPFGQGAASGKIGAMVASHNRGGQYLRARTKPVNPATVFQQAVRNALRTLVSLWTSVLTQVQRDAWTNYGDNVTVTDNLGDQRTRTGQNWYIGNNTIRLQCDLPRVDAAPTVFDQGDTGVGTMELGTTTRGTLTLSTPPTGWTSGTGTAGSDSLAMYIGRPIPNSRGFFKGPYQLAGTLISPNTIGTFVLPSPVAGADNQAFSQYRILRGDGRVSGPYQNSFPGV